jgi:hypothetical protein
MLSLVKGVLIDLVSSKKAVAAASAAVAYCVVRVAAHYHFALDDAAAQQVGDRLVALALAYVGGQALADHGKEAAAIQAGKVD